MIECESTHQTGPDPYDLAEQAFATKVAQLQQAGRLLTPPQITDEEALEAHFDALRVLYRETCSEMGLSWPPPEEIYERT